MKTRILNFIKQLRALCRKELRQILRDRQLLFMLVAAPVLQITLYSFALSPEVEHLRLGVVDYANSPASRELVAKLVHSGVFDLCSSEGTDGSLAKKVRDGKLEAGLIIPPEFERRLKNQTDNNVQFFLDGVDANSAGIASGYILQIVYAFDQQLKTGTQYPSQLISPQISYVYNPGLESRWFFVPGVLAMMLILVSTLVSSAAVIREKETGTLEQLLMTPVTSIQVLIGKIIPLSIVLLSTVLISLFLSVCVFGVPFEGNIILFLFVSLIAITVGISVGLALASFCANQRQAFLTSFFINLPLILLSGALAPIESMPAFWQSLSVLDPLRYYVFCVRAIMLKGATIELIWKQILILAIFALVLLWTSTARFRNQLS